MTTSMIAFTLVVTVALLLGVHIAISFSLAGITFVLLEGIPTSIVIQTMVSGVDSLALLAVPLFILAGDLMSQGGVAKRLVRIANLFIGDVPGGLVYVTILASVFFASLTGSAMASSVAIGSIMMPYMLKAGYKPRIRGAGAS